MEIKSKCENTLRIRMLWTGTRRLDLLRASPLQPLPIFGEIDFFQLQIGEDLLPPR